MRNLFILIFALGMLFFTSCAMHKVTYLDDMVPNLDYPVGARTVVKIQKDDKLSIEVSSKNPELAVPFNLGIGAYKVSNDGDLTSSSGSLREKGYTVGQEGYIEFPVLGKLHVEGLTQQELADMIKNILVTQNLIKDPLVAVDLLNFKITVLGETGVGVVTVQDKRMNILELLAKSGGVQSNGRLEDVAVIREVGGVRKMYNVNLRSVSLFDSPVYYLQQNDIVYVKPQAGKPTQTWQNRWTYISAVTGLVSLVLTLLILTK